MPRAFSCDAVLSLADIIIKQRFLIVIEDLDKIITCHIQILNIFFKLNKHLTTNK